MINVRERLGMFSSINNHIISVEADFVDEIANLDTGDKSGNYIKG